MNHESTEHQHPTKPDPSETMPRTPDRPSRNPVKINEKLIFKPSLVYDFSDPDAPDQPYAGNWFSCEQRYFQSPGIQIHIDTLREDPGEIDWAKIERFVAFAAENEALIFRMAEEVMTGFFKSSNLLNYNYFLKCHGVYVPRFLDIPYDRLANYQEISEFEFVFEPDFWDSDGCGDFDLHVEFHNYSSLFVNGVRWYARDYAYIRPEGFVNKNLP